MRADYDDLVYRTEEAKFKAVIDEEMKKAQDLLSKLITHDLTKRLGNLYGGPQDVKNHPWFAEVTWDRLQKKDIDAPYVPPVRAGVGDASQFDKYPEETEAYGQAGDDPCVAQPPYDIEHVLKCPNRHGHLFPDF